MTQPPDDFSRHFPVLQRMDFFNHAGVAPISGPAAAALRAYTEQAESRAYVQSGWYARAREVKRAAARLIGARGPHEIAFIANTTTGIAQVANGLNFRGGDRVVITNVEYPANRYPWEHLARTRGVEMFEVAQQPDGRIELEDVLDAINDRTRVVAISHVQYASGFRTKLRPIADLVHQAGGYLCVDAIQSVGVLPVDVRADGVDFLAADGHKWMLAPEGCGIFYCHEDLIELLTPSVVGWMNMENAQDYGNYQYALLTDARRFEPGSYNIPGILALGASLDLLLGVGIDEVWRRVDALCDHAEKCLKTKGYRVFSPRRHEHERSGILCFHAPEGGQPEKEILALAQQANIELALREGRLRISPHFYNTREQIDRFLAALP